MALTQETRQALFEKVVNGLMAQRAYGYNESEGACSYYAQDNGKVVRCAVGLLVSEDEAKVLQKDAGSFLVLMSNPVARAIFEPIGVSRQHDADFLHALQLEHDNLTVNEVVKGARDFDAAELLTAMHKFGKKRKLDVSFIEALMKKEDEA